MTLRQYGLSAPGSYRSLSNNKALRSLKLVPRSVDMRPGPVDMALLATQLQALPQELNNAIYDFVFTPDQRLRIMWPENRPQARLQVDRHSRKMFAKSYYGNGATFDFRNMSEEVFVKWLEGRAPEHRALLKHTIFTVDRCAPNQKQEGGSTLFPTLPLPSWMNAETVKSRLLKKLWKLGMKDVEKGLKVENC